MKQNYQLILDRTIKEECHSRRPTLLLHACCAPCSSYVLEYLSEYFDGQTPENPYIEDPREIRCVSVSPNGDVLGGNLYKRDIMEIIKDYAP